MTIDPFADIAANLSAALSDDWRGSWLANTLTQLGITGQRHLRVSTLNGSFARREHGQIL